MCSSRLGCSAGKRSRKPRAPRFERASDSSTPAPRRKHPWTSSWSSSAARAWSRTLITPHEVERVKGELLALLDEDSHNEERILGRLSQIRCETGIQVHSALLLILTHLMMDEEE